MPLSNQIKLDLAVARQNREAKKKTCAGAKIITKTGLNTFREAIFMLWKGRCFNCQSTLNPEKLFTRKQYGVGHLLDELFSCEKCSTLAHVKRIEKTPELLARFNEAVEEIAEKKRLAYSLWVKGKECDYVISKK